MVLSDARQLLCFIVFEGTTSETATLPSEEICVVKNRVVERQSAVVADAKPVVTVELQRAVAELDLCVCQIDGVVLSQTKLQVAQGGGVGTWHTGSKVAK